MRKIMIILIPALVTVFAGCHQKQNSRINISEGVGSDTLSSNIVTKPIIHAFSALMGEGIEITEAIVSRNDAGFLELYVNGYNRSFKTKRFKYKVEWFDGGGLLIPSRTSTWLPFSATGKSNFTIKVVSSTEEAANFRMNTKK